MLVESTSTESTLYVYGLHRLAQVSEGDTEWFLGDALGSVRQLVGDDGDVILARDYTPYGQPLSESGTGSSKYAFTGEQWDSDIALLFLRARHYRPEVGLFLSRDPVNQNHPYLYVKANPINLIDPTGEDPWEGTQIHFMIEAHYLHNYAQGRLVLTEQYRIPGGSKTDAKYQTSEDGSIRLVLLQTVFDIQNHAIEAHLSLSKPSWKSTSRTGNWK